MRSIEEAEIYASGKSGWVGNRQGLSNQFIVYNDEIGKMKDLRIAWDYKPTKRMVTIAKRMIVNHKNNNGKKDFLFLIENNKFVEKTRGTVSWPKDFQ